MLSKTQEQLNNYPCDNKRIQVWQKCWEFSSRKRIESPMVLELMLDYLVTWCWLYLPLLGFPWFLPISSTWFSSASTDCETCSVLLQKIPFPHEMVRVRFYCLQWSLDSQTYQNLRTFTLALIISHYHSCCNKQRSLKFLKTLLFNDCVFQQQNLLTQGRKEWTQSKG